MIELDNRELLSVVSIIVTVINVVAATLLISDYRRAMAKETAKFTEQLRAVAQNQTILLERTADSKEGFIRLHNAISTMDNSLTGLKAEDRTLKLQLKLSTDSL